MELYGTVPLKRLPPSQSALPSKQRCGGSLSFSLLRGGEKVEPVVPKGASLAPKISPEGGSTVPVAPGGEGEGLTVAL